MTALVANRYNSRALPDAEQQNTVRRDPGKPIRVVLRWQFVATVCIAGLAGWQAGVHGAMSALAGGAISMVAGWTSARVSARGRQETAGGILLSAIIAEGVKLGLIGVLLGLAFWLYGEMVVLAFLGSFVLTVLIFSMAFFVSDRH
ncbi:MAG TPA: ATP synthase subunit I [Burkholderiales bacterium]